MRACSTGLGDKHLGVPELSSAGQLVAGSSTSLGLLSLTRKMEEGVSPCRLGMRGRQATGKCPGHNWQRAAFFPASHPCPQTLLPPLTTPNSPPPALWATHSAHSQSHYQNNKTTYLPIAYDVQSPLRMLTQDNLAQPYRWGGRTPVEVTVLPAELVSGRRRR